MKTFLLLLLTSVLAYSGEIGIASHYSVRSNKGTKTASGEKLRDDSFTAAHKTLPFGTVVKVICLKTNKSVKVTINNRGPFVAGRIIDLSQAAAKQLGIIERGIAKVKVEIIKKPTQPKR
jgi:rare lipoprotein A